MTATYDSLLAGRTSPGIYRWVGDVARDLATPAVDAGWDALSLDTSDVVDTEGFYEEITTSWGLPPWFGNNLDALFDMLGEISSTPTVLIWDDLGALGGRQPDFAAAVLDVMRDCVEQAQCLAVILRGDSGISVFDALL